MRKLPLFVAIPLGCAAGFAAGVGVILLTSKVVSLEPTWMGEGVLSVLSAAAWMGAGLAVAQRNEIAAPFIFLPGAAVCWFVTRGVVHSVTPYFGLFSILVSCLSAAVVWFLFVRHSDWRYARISAVAVPLVTAIIVAGASLAKPNLGVTRRLQDASSRNTHVHMVTFERNQQYPTYLWTESTGTLRLGADSIIAFEPDPGSGKGRYRLTRVRNESEIEEICNRLRESARRGAEHEIAGGATPRFITRLPTRPVKCERGIVWQTR